MIENLTGLSIVVIGSLMGVSASMNLFNEGMSKGEQRRVREAGCRDSLKRDEEAIVSKWLTGDIEKVKEDDK